MNIVFVSDAIYPYSKGGKEKRLYELSTRLAKLGHEVHIYTMHWWGTKELTKIENGVQLHAICKLHKMYNGETRSIKQGILFGIACFKLLPIKFEILDVDHMPFFPIYSSWIVCRLRRKKFYGTWHEALSRKDWTDYMGILGNIAYVIEDISIKLPHVISASSSQTKRGLRAIHGRSTGVMVVTPGIDTNLIKSVSPIKESIDILYVGRLVKDKNVDKLVQSVDLIRSKNKGVRCTIIGHGPEKQNILNQIKVLELDGNITLLEPLINDIEIYAFMKAAKVLCLPSIREGFGMVALEAIACGTPVVTIDVPSNSARNLVQGGINGSLTSIEVTDLAGAISQWIARPKPINIAEQVEKYDWDFITKQQEAVYAS